MANHNHVVDKNGNVTTDNVENAINKMDSGKKDQILKDFQSFKQFLAKRVEMGERMGLGEEQLAKAAEKVAGYLAEHEDPRNSEEYLLREMWKVADKDERHKLAHILLKLAQSSK